MPSRALILVSASPRRSDLLRQAGLDFTVRPADLDESPLPGEAPGELAVRLACAKARALPALPGPALAIAADTVVAIDGTILGKPRDLADARRMLGLLSGRTHHVITGVALRALPEESLVSERAESLVTFVPMTAEEIAWYAATGEGMDKAGAYALQGIGAFFIASIEGSYTNVIGLPLERLHTHLRRYGLIEPAPARRT
jgi:nucleoside triphosphate pyrophosphatase